MTGMNILWISHFVPYPPKGGCFQRSYNLIKEAARDNNVYLVALRHKDKSTHPESEMIKAKEELGKFCKEVHIIDIKSFTRGYYYWLALKSIFTSDPLTVNLFKSEEMHNLIKYLSNRIKFDIAHYDTISLVEYIDDTGNIPKYLTHHGVESFMIRRRVNNESSYLKKLYLIVEAYKLRRYEKINCFKFNLNIMVSEDDKNMLKEISPTSRIEVVENGVDVDFFLPKNNHENTNRLIFAGRLDQYSNMDAVLHFCMNIWPLIKKRIPEIRFSIIGNNPPQKLFEIAKNDDKIEILGYVDDVRPFFEKATISVCPIRDGGGTRIKILDAMAMGMPIVSTTIGCEGIDVIHGENILIANTTKEFIDNVEILTCDRILREKISKYARRTVEAKYSWSIIGNKLNKYYDNCMKYK
jgi:polysaccharide biosynthesis protein PslH